MGEANTEAIARIKQITGHSPRYSKNSDGQQCLHIADTVVVATEFALWGDPSIWEDSDDSISVAWGGQVARLARNPDGSWTAEIYRDLLQDKARFVT